MSLLLLVTGASCAGKTTAIESLRSRTLDIEVHDFDEVGLPSNADKPWRRNANEAWVRHAISADRPVVLAGQSPFGEILAAPSATSVDGVAGCLFDCNDWVRVERLVARGRPPADQHQLSWAAWHRLHSCDPQWEQHVIKAPQAAEARWYRWDRWQRGDPRWQFDVVDTSSLTPAACTDWLAAWIARQIEMVRSGQLPLSGRWWDDPL